MSGREGLGKEELSGGGSNEGGGGGGGGGRVGKRSRSPSVPTSSERANKYLCLLAFHADTNDPFLYTVNFDDKAYKSRNFCEKCSSKLFGSCGEDQVGGGGSGNNVKKDNSGLRQIFPPPIPWCAPKSTPLPYGNMVVAIGSTVYVLGGEDEEETKVVEETKGGEEEKEEDDDDDEKNRRYKPSSEVIYYDTAQVEEEERILNWKQASDMLNGRDGGKAVAVDGKIYVFGGNDMEKAPEPWAEVFDPTKNKWDPLPQNPWAECIQHSELRAPVVVYGVGEKKIMMGNSAKYVYHVKPGRWEKLDIVVYRSLCIKPVGVGNLLYFTKNGCLRAINMEARKFYSGKILGSRLGKPKLFCNLCDYDPDIEPPLVHLGGREFCFFTLCGTRDGGTKICCTKFQVTKRIAPNADHSRGILRGTVLSHVKCVVDASLLANAYALAMDGRMLNEEKQVEKEVAAEMGRAD